MSATNSTTTLASTEGPGSAVKMQIEKAKKAKKFTEDEDKALSRAYVATTTDCLTGVNQKGSVFWKAVKEAYEQVIVDDGLLGPFASIRPMGQLKNRFQKYLQPEMNLFCPQYRRAKQEQASGTNEEDIYQTACLEYAICNGKAFRFKHVFDILKVLPRFDPMLMDDAKAAEDGVEDDNTVIQPDGTVMGRYDTTNKLSTPKSAERPMGTKKAVSLQKSEEAKLAHRKKVQELWNESNGVGKDLVRAGNRLIDLEMTKTLFGIGMQDQARSLANRIWCDRHSPSSPPTAVDVPTGADVESLLTETQQEQI